MTSSAVPLLARTLEEAARDYAVAAARLKAANVELVRLRSLLIVGDIECRAAMQGVQDARSALTEVAEMDGQSR